MKKVEISAVVVFVTCILVMNTVSGVGVLKDIKNTDWFYENVMVLVNKGIIEGDTKGDFLPNATMTADQFIKTMVVALGYPLEKGESYWAQPFIDKAIAIGIVKSGDFSSYRNPITRGEMAMLTVRVVEMLEGAKNYTYTGYEADKLTNSISDYSAIKASLKPFVLKAYELGTITGYPDGSFKAGTSLKRSEACTVIRRVIDAGTREPFVYLGIEIMDNLDGHDPELLDFNLLLNVLSPLEPQYNQAEAFLIKAVGKELTDKIMALVKTKTDDDNLKSTYFKWENNKKIEVVSPNGNFYITIRGW